MMIDIGGLGVAVPLYSSSAQIPLTASALFEGASSQAIMPAPVADKSFEGASGDASTSDNSLFNGASSGVIFSDTDDDVPRR